MSHFRILTAVTCLICFTGCFSGKEPPPTETASASVPKASRHGGLSSEGELIAERLEKFISRALANQSNPNRAVKNENSLSADETANVVHLESFITHSLTEIPNTSVVDDYIVSFQKLNEAMTPEVQLANVKRLVAINWNLGTLRWLSTMQQKKPSSVEELTNAIMEADELVDEPQSGANQALMARVTSERDSINASLGKEVDQIVARFFDGQPVLDSSANTILESVQKALDTIDPEQTLELRTKYKTLVNRLELQSALKQFIAQINRLDKLEDPSEKQAASNQILQSLIALKIRVVLEGLIPTDVQEVSELSGLIKKVSQTNEKAMRDLVEQQNVLRREYQNWALTSILDVRKNWNLVEVDIRFNKMLADARGNKPSSFDALKFPAVLARVNELAKCGLTDDNVSTDQGKKIVAVFGGYTSDQTKPISQLSVREAIINLLLPIDTRLLEQPVAELYQQTWLELWNPLEGAPESPRSVVAKASINVKKFGLDDFPR
jgi:hypothetical protein